MELFLAWMLGSLAVLIFFGLYRAVSLWRQGKIDFSDPTQAQLAREGYFLNEGGVTECLTCGGYCGQCGDDRSGLSLAEYRNRYWRVLP